MLSFHSGFIPSGHLTHFSRSRIELSMFSQCCRAKHVQSVEQSYHLRLAPSQRTLFGITGSTSQEHRQSSLIILSSLLPILPRSTHSTALLNAGRIYSSSSFIMKSLRSQRLDPGNRSMRMNSSKPPGTQEVGPCGPGNTSSSFGVEEQAFDVKSRKASISLAAYACGVVDAPLASSAGSIEGRWSARRSGTLLVSETMARQS